MRLNRFSLIAAALVLFAGVLASATGQTLRATLKETYGKGSLTTSAVSPDGSLIAVAATPVILLCDSETLTRKGILEGGHSEPIKSLLFDASGETLASVGWTGQVCLWNVAERRLRGSFDALAADKDADRETEEFTLTFDTSGTHLHVRWKKSGSPEESGVWRIEDGAPVSESDATFPLNTSASAWGDTLTNVLLSPDGRLVFGKSAESSWQVWNTEARSLVFTLPMRSFRSVRFSKDSRFLVVGTFDTAGTFVVDIGAGKMLALSRLPFVAMFACDLPLREEQLMPLTKDGYILAGRPLAGQLIDLLPNDLKPWAQNWIRAGALRTCDAMPPEIDGYYRDGWFEIPRLAFAYDSPHRMWAVSVSHVYLMQSGSPKIDLWDDPTRQQVGSLEGHVPKPFGGDKKGLEYVHALTFSPDGRFLASGGHDRTVRLWNVGTQELSLTLEGHRAPVRYLAFSPDGRALLSGSEDGTVRVWEFNENYAPSP